MRAAAHVAGEVARAAAADAVAAAEAKAQGASSSDLLLGATEGCADEGTAGESEAIFLRGPCSHRCNLRDQTRGETSSTVDEGRECSARLCLQQSIGIGLVLLFVDGGEVMSAIGRLVVVEGKYAVLEALRGVLEAGGTNVEEGSFLSHRGFQLLVEDGAIFVHIKVVVEVMLAQCWFFVSRKAGREPRHPRVLEI